VLERKYFTLYWFSFASIGKKKQADAMDAASICFEKSENVKPLPAEGLEAELLSILYS